MDNSPAYHNNCYSEAPPGECCAHLQDQSQSEVCPHELKNTDQY